MNTGRSLLMLSALGLLASCFPKLEGATCTSDSNCPDKQLCVSGFCASTGTGSGGGTGGGATGGGTGGGATGGGGGSSDGGIPSLRELTSAGARMTNGNLTMDLELGHPTPRTKMTGGNLEVTGAAAVQR